MPARPPGERLLRRSGDVNRAEASAGPWQLGIRFERIEVDILKGGSRTPEFLKKNHNGRIPVLEPGISGSPSNSPQACDGVIGRSGLDEIASENI